MQGRGDARRLTKIFFPRLLRPGNAQVRHRETDQSGLGFAAPSGGALVADLAARAGCRPREGRNGSRVVMCFDLHQRVRQRVMISIGTFAIRVKPSKLPAFHDRRIVRVGDHRALRVGLMRFTDHAKQTFGARLAVYHPGGVEYLVTAVLRIGLCKHGQFGVGRIAARAAEMVEQIIDFVGRQCQPHVAIGALQRGLAAIGKVDHLERPWRDVTEQGLRVFEPLQHRLDHAVVHQRQHLGTMFRQSRGIGKIPGAAALDARHRLKAALAGDIGRLGGPW